ncbi:MAG: hypothetical protein FWD92_00570 [Methanomassiliicoccaceae archaeon]|nr:hypothetical protein [Methanomassiliicoccaceae archaeon]
MLSITVRSEGEDERIPVTVASDVMRSIQLLLTHIGESFISEEFGSYGRPSSAFVKRFTLYIDPDGGISFGAEKERSELVNKTASLLTAVLENTGAGTYWMEDAFSDPVYRSVILYDLMQLSRCLSADEGYTLQFEHNEKKGTFAPIDMNKAQAFLERSGTSHGNVVGILNSVQTKRNVPMYGFLVGEERVKISLNSKEIEDHAAKYVNRAVLVKGTLRYAENGRLSEISDIVSLEPFDKRPFTRIISAERDILLSKPLEANVSYDAGNRTWKLSYPDLGMTSSDQDWDVAVAGFHDYFVFLWENYSTKENNELSEEEIEVKELLSSMVNKTE